MSQKRSTYVPFRQYVPFDQLPTDVLIAAHDLIDHGCNGLIPTIMKDVHSLRIAKDTYVLPVGTRADNWIPAFRVVNYDSCALIAVTGDFARWLYTAYDDLMSLHFSQTRKSFFVQTYEDYSGNFRSTMFDLNKKNWLNEKEDHHNW